MKPTRPLYELEEERAVPWGDAGFFAAHLARYRFAVPHVRGKRVLEVGFGEGYGAALLAEHASEVVAVDYSPAALRHAVSMYATDNLSFRLADAAALGPDVTGFDVVTCFEVIEHVSDHDGLVRGLARGVTDAGLVLLSTPNRVVERLVEEVSGAPHYEYHVAPLAPAELKALLQTRFARVELYGQALRGNLLHTALKTMDPLNLRHRLVRSPRLQEAACVALGRPHSATTAPSFRFSRVAVRQSPTLVALARKS